MIILVIIIELIAFKVRTMVLTIMVKLLSLVLIASQNLF